MGLRDGKESVLTPSTAPDGRKRLLMIVGLFLLTAGSICLRFHWDFFAGVGYGAGIASLAVWIYRRRR
jgi:hypothetical protein